MRRSPLPFDEIGPFEPVQSRIQRALIDSQDFLRELLNALCDSPAMQRPGNESLEDEKIKDSLEKLGFCLFHWNAFRVIPSHPTIAPGIVGCQGIMRKA